VFASVDPEYFLSRAAEARQSFLDAANPEIRAIHQELVWRYEQLASLPDTTPIGMLRPSDSPRDVAMPAVVLDA
jgi:hypothetical protein